MLQHGETKQLQVYYGSTIKKGAAGDKHPNMEAGPQTGHEGARDCNPPDRGRGLGHWAVAHFPKTCAQCTDGSKTVPMGALSACCHT